jgi:hypothetical protein
MNILEVDIASYCTYIYASGWSFGVGIPLLAVGP